METQKMILELQKQLFAKNLEVNSLLEITQAINNNVSFEELFRIYEFILRAQLRLSKLVLVARPELEDNWKVGAEHGVEITLTGEMLQELGTVVDTIEVSKGIFEHFQNIIPVFHKGTPLAYVLIEKGKEQIASKDDLQFIETLTNIVVVAIENQKLIKKQIGQERLKREMELAGEIQHMLIPSTLPNDPYVSMSSEYQPHSEVGGDYFDVFEINREESVYCLGDISGKGISAALLMSNFQANLRALVYQDLDLTELVAKLNERFTQITNGERFITFVIARYNKVTRSFEYISCGHNPTYLIEGGQLHKLSTGCTLLGMFDELPVIQKGKLTLKEDALLFMYSDGIIDVVNSEDEHYEEERLETFLLNNADLEATDLKEKLMNEVNEYRGKEPFPDDVTFLIAKFNLIG